MFLLPCINQAQKCVNKQKHSNIYDVFYARYCNEHVSTSNSVIFKEMFLLKEYNRG
jgi:TATA-binding protein-associated factor Taf7